MSTPDTPPVNLNTPIGLGALILAAGATMDPPIADEELDDVARYIRAASMPPSIGADGHPSTESIVTFVRGAITRSRAMRDTTPDRV